MQKKFDNKFLFGYTLHLQALVKRIKENKIIVNSNLTQIKKEYNNEFILASKITNLLSEKFALTIPYDERAFLSILFANNKSTKDLKNDIDIIVICHGNSTASSMTNVANTLLNSNEIKSIDMPLSTKISTIYENLRDMILSSNKKEGVLLLVDMGSLVNFKEQLIKETGIDIKLIDHVSTPLVIEALRLLTYKKTTLDKLYTELLHIENNINNSFNTLNKDIVILTFCTTGEGGGMIAQKFVTDLLSEHNYNVKVILTDYDNLSTYYETNKNKFNIIATIGNIRPDISLPFFSLIELMDSSFKEKLVKLIDYSSNNIQTKELKKTENDTIYTKAKDLLEKYVKFINPKLALFSIKKFLDILNLNITENDSENLDLIIHLGCMLDRCLHNINIKFDNKLEFINNNNELFDKIKKTCDIFKEDFEIDTSDDEICYIIKVLQK